MDELSSMMSALLLHKVKQLPALNDLRLDLQGVYDKHCDLSLILKSIPLHAPQLTSLSLQQAAMLNTKSVVALSDMPHLSSLTLKNAHGFEPGALAKLSSIPHLTHLHLEVMEQGSTSAAGSSATGSTVQVSAVGAGSRAVSLTPSELARLQASDEVGLAKCTRLVSLAAVNLATAGALRPVEALLGAIAGSLKPRLASLVLGNMAELPLSVVEVAAGIPSLCHVSLAGCDVAGSADVAKLSVLSGLLTGFGATWRSLTALEISGWGVDEVGVAAIMQLEGLSTGEMDSAPQHPDMVRGPPPQQEHALLVMHHVGYKTPPSVWDEINRHEAASVRVRFWAASHHQR
ncbi:hypothetical protein COO60DRAFT_1457945 [Scenedesmus sp. NREL 46B-D3]|nr:hypothetical protein COO60DRAFT_1457945 [Scenedesmus sp. NREL 46B-D3]